MRLLSLTTLIVPATLFAQMGHAAQISDAAARTRIKDITYKLLHKPNVFKFDLGKVHVHGGLVTVKGLHVASNHCILDKLPVDNFKLDVDAAEES